LLSGEKVADEIRKIPRLETLEMSGNTLGVDASLPIAEALEGHPELKVVSCSAPFSLH
jgi:Ran GTPase-activating protein (RanGAP) involved in mRNA processing and transport